MKKIIWILPLVLLSLINCKSQRSDLGKITSKASIANPNKYAVGLSLAKEAEFGSYSEEIINKTGFGVYEFTVCESKNDIEGKIEIIEGTCKNIFKNKGKPSYFLHGSKNNFKTTSGFIQTIGIKFKNDSVSNTASHIKSQLSTLAIEENNPWSQFVDSTNRFITGTESSNLQAPANSNAANDYCKKDAFIGALTTSESFSIGTIPACFPNESAGSSLAAFVADLYAMRSGAQWEKNQTLKYIKNNQTTTAELNKELSEQLNAIFTANSEGEMSYITGEFYTADLLIKLKEEFFTNLKFSDEPFVVQWLQTSTTH